MPLDPDVDAVIAALHEVGVDFSIPRPSLVDFLGNAEFTPYPALAEALLRALKDRGLRLPVFLDVIVFNYEHSPGNPSPRRVEDVDGAVLEAAVIEGFNNRHGEQNTTFQSILKPLDTPTPIPIQTLALSIEGSSIVKDGVTLVDTDNPRVEVTTKLIDVSTVAGIVPQGLRRQGNGWRFTNGDVELSVSGGEAEAGPRPAKAGSLSEGAKAWPTVEATFSTGSEVRLQARIRVGYRPVDVKLLVEGPKGFAANTAERARIALDPEVLLVPVEVAKFFSDRHPVSNITMAGQMALWDQVPIMSPTTNFRSVDGGTGELRSADRAWDFWPTPDAKGLYGHGVWLSPDSIWGKAKVRFRLVNYIEIKTDDQHTAPAVIGGGSDPQFLIANHVALGNHPQHLEGVLEVIFMHRAHSQESQHPGRALLGTLCVGLSASGSASADIAHEIGHLIIDSDRHSTLGDNVLFEIGPGTEITDNQAQLAREWAQKFAGFWQH
jgi:hypothetical protein